jgi:hypothetical protein
MPREIKAGEYELVQGNGAAAVSFTTIMVVLKYALNH